MKSNNLLHRSFKIRNLIQFSSNLASTTELYELISKFKELLLLKLFFIIKKQSAIWVMRLFTDKNFTKKKKHKV